MQMSWDAEKKIESERERERVRNRDEGFFFLSRVAAVGRMIFI